MVANFTASDLRKFAMRCAEEANRVTDSADQDRLRKMSEMFLQLAGNEDWLNGNWQAHPMLKSDPAIQALAERIFEKR